MGQGETEVWGKAHPGGEMQRIVVNAAFARVYLLEKWDLGTKERVNMKSSYLRRVCG